MAAIGDTVQNLWHLEGRDDFQAWSPAGTRIIFMTDHDGGDIEICAMNADGQNQANLTNNPAMEFSSIWVQ
jgi:TolB protein